MNQESRREKTVMIHSAASEMEAMVIRGLLESKGIASPGSANTDMFPMGEPGDAFHSADVIVLESQADEARKIIAEYLKSNEGIEMEGSEDSSK